MGKPIDKIVNLVLSLNQVSTYKVEPLQMGLLEIGNGFSPRIFLLGYSPLN